MYKFRMNHFLDNEIKFSRLIFKAAPLLTFVNCMALLQSSLSLSFEYLYVGYIALDGTVAY